MYWYIVLTCFMFKFSYFLRKKPQINKSQAKQNKN